MWEQKQQKFATQYPSSTPPTFPPCSTKWHSNLALKDAGIVTGWVCIGLEELIFERRDKPLWVEDSIPPYDSVMQVMEGLSGRDDSKEKGQAAEWWNNEVTLSVWLKEDVMEKLTEDGEFRVFPEV